MARTQSLKVSEIFASIQGEGVTAGEPATFLRLATCNLHCSFCDTKYTWDFNNHRYEDEVRVLEVSEVSRTIADHAPRRLVITGGEPMLQQPGVTRVLELLGPDFVVEVETNGTLEPSPELAARVAQWNVSPKLANSGNREGLRLRPQVLARYLATGRAFLKLVVRDASDTEEAAALVTRLGWPTERVLFMPEARTPEELTKRHDFVRAESLARGFGVSPRLHVERFGGRRGT